MDTATQHRDAEEQAKKKMKLDSPLVSSIPPFPTDDKFLRMLIHIKADFVRPQENKVFVAARTDNIVEVWKGLAAHNFLSCPVLQKTKNRYYGFIDMWDIVKYVVDFFGTSDDQLLRNSEDWIKLVSAHEEFMKKTVNDIMKYPLTKRNPFFPIHSGFSVFAAIEALAKEKQLHRVPIIDADRKLVTVVTQSQIVKMIAQNLELIGERRHLPVSKMNRFLEKVFAVHEDSVAMDAFRMMVEHEVSGVAVIDNDGKLTGTVSVRDLKAVSVDTRMFWRLYQTMKNFLLKVRRESNETGGDRPRSVVTVKSTDTLESVVRKLAENDIHRIFIVDDNKKPIGVISFKDVLYEIISG